MRENRTYGSEGGGAGNSTGSSYPYCSFALAGLEMFTHVLRVPHTPGSAYSGFRVLRVAPRQVFSNGGVVNPSAPGYKGCAFGNDGAANRRARGRED